MNLLIIGSKGFIGSSLLQYFSSDEKYIVYGCDIIIDFTAKNYFIVDKFKPKYFEIFEQVKFDVCINCSGAASVPDSFLDPQIDYQLNTTNVFLILDAMKKLTPSCKFITLSSAAVYGNPSALPIHETSAVSPISPYAFHKLHAELLCEEFNRLYGLMTCSLRIFSAYGNGLKKQLFWDTWCKIKQNKIITFFGTGLESRDFIHVNDIAYAIDLIIKNGEFNCSVYNIGNGKEVLIRDAIKIFCSYIDRSVEVKFSNMMRKGDPVNWCSDITKIKKLGYHEKVNLKLGLNEYAKWLKKSN